MDEDRTRATSLAQGTSGTPNQSGFPQRAWEKLTRNGADYILQQAVERAVKEYPSLRDKKVTPHMLCHTTATHLL
jgi:integrase/recombinase XerD